jgi:hypothetical protein
LKRIKKVLKWVAIGLICLLIVAQFYRPAKTNPATDRRMTIDAHTQMIPQVSAILDRSCRDCHSNETRWPWYSHVAPVSWFVIDHVDHGRKHLNFSEWGRYERNDMANLLRDICREVKSVVMPLDSYLWMHRGARLSEEDIKEVCDWTNSERERIRPNTEKN